MYKEKRLTQKRLQKMAYILSKEVFNNPYTYPIIFVDPKDVKTAKFYPYADIPEGHEDECIIEVSKKMRQASIEDFILCLLYCLYQYNAWWTGVEPTDYSITRAELNNFIEILENM